MAALAAIAAAPAARPRPAAAHGQRSRRRGGGRLDALDGLRALAVAAVILYHLRVIGNPVANPLRPSGGYVGVDVFFVLSGYLITTLLLREQEGTGSVHAGRFYLRRACRLLPAFAAATGLALLVARAVDGTALAPLAAGTRSGLWWVVAFVGNWREVLHQVDNGLLGLTWTLSVEEQFYLVVPWVLLAVLARRSSSRRLLAAGVLAGLAVAQSIARLWGVGHVSPITTSFSTIYHSDGLLIGAALALCLSLPPVAAAVRRPAVQVAIQASGAAALVAIVGVILRCDGSQAGEARAVPAAVAATAVLVTALVSAPRGPAGRVLALRPLVWVGRRSYGLYLYGYTLEVLVAHLLGVDVHDPSLAYMGAVLAADLAVATLSYGLIERPFLALAARRAPRQAQDTRIAVAPAAAEAGPPGRRPPAARLGATPVPAYSKGTEE